MADTDNELVIYLKLITEDADRTDQAFHARARQRAGETARAQTKAEKEAQREREGILKDAAKAADTYRREQLAKQKADYAERLKADNDYVKARMTALKAEAQLEKEANQARSSALKQASTDAKAAIAESLRVEKDAFAEGRAMAKRLGQIKDEQNKMEIAAVKATNLEKQKSDDAYVASMRKQANIAGQLEKERLRALDKEENAVLTVARAYTTMRIASEVSQAVHAVWGAMAQTAQETRDYIQGQVDELERMRTVARELLALRGEQPTPSNVAAIGFRAAAAGRSFEEQHAFELELEAQAGTYIGGPQQLISREAMEAFGAEVSPYMAGRGVKGKEQAELTGALLSVMKPDVTTGEIDTKMLGDMMAKVLKTIERAPGRTGPELRQFMEVLQEEIQPGDPMQKILDLATVFRAETVRNPRTASAYTRALFRGLREARAKPETAQELGLKPGMDTFQELAAVETAMNRWLPQHPGMTQADFIGEYFKEARKYGSTMTAVRRGLGPGGVFERSQAEMATVDMETIRREGKTSLQDPEGRRQAGLAALAATKAQNAGRFAYARQVELDARLAVATSRELEKSEPWYAALATYAPSWLGGRTREEQETAFIMDQTITRKLMGSQRGRDYVRRQFRRIGYTDWATMSGDELRQAVEANQGTMFGGRFAKMEDLGPAGRMVEEIQKQTEEMKKQTMIMQEQRAGNVPAPHVPDLKMFRLGGLMPRM
jgi:hypothetical protein